MKILIIFGTRPEAIKMAPVYNELKSDNFFDVKICNTGQHTDLLKPILDFFNLKIDYELEVMKHNQSLHELTSNIIEKIKIVLEDFNPDYVMVHGDTTTSFAAGLATFYSNIKLIHIEAGLRSFDKKAPFPEEINRSLTARISDLNFAPTIKAKENLIKENIEDSSIYVTGNTVIDALLLGKKIIKSSKLKFSELDELISNTKYNILFTGHRRENFGNGFDNIFKAIEELTNERNDIRIIYPIHPNPNIRGFAEKYFKHNTSVKIINPLNYDELIYILSKIHIVITDSGGIQEEAPSFGKPVLVIREKTERTEAIDCGTVKLVGTDINKIKSNVNILLEDKEYYKKISEIKNPYGDGTASKQIINILKKLNEK